MQASSQAKKDLGWAEIAEAAAWLTNAATDSPLTLSDVEGVQSFFALSEKLGARASALASAIEMCQRQRPLVSLIYDLNPSENGEYLEVSAKISRALTEPSAHRALTMIIDAAVKEVTKQS